MKILLVEDDLATRRQLSSLLKKFTYQVVCVNDGVEMLEKLQTEYFDLVITDIGMPHLNGHAATVIANTQLRIDIPIIAVTGLNIKSFPIEVFDAVFSKPVQLSNLLDTIKELTCPKCKKLMIKHLEDINTIYYCPDCNSKWYASNEKQVLKLIQI